MRILLAVLQPIIGRFKVFLCLVLYCSTLSAKAQERDEIHHTVLSKDTQEVSQQKKDQKSALTDTEILQGLEKLNINSEVLLLKKDKDLLNANATQQKELIATKPDEKISEQQIIDDSFADLDIEFILRDNDTYGLTDLNKKQKKITDLTKKNPNIQSVGVNGAEEALINKLDKSDLMDFNKNSDVWSKEIDPLEVDIDELTEDHIELDDNQLIDEINGIE